MGKGGAIHPASTRRRCRLGGQLAESALGEPGARIDIRNRSHAVGAVRRQMGLSNRSKFAGGERGAALVEAAMVLPFLLLLTFGIWTTARAWNIHNTLDHAAREGARFGATEEPWVVGTSDLAVRDVVDSALSSSAIDPTDVNSCIELITDGNSGCGVTNTTGTDQIHVNLGYPGLDLNFLFFSANIDLEATAVARHEAN